MLTPLGTVRHTSKVTWHHSEPLGKFLPVRDRDMRMPAADTTPVEYDHDIVERLWDEPEKLEAAEEARERESGKLDGDEKGGRVWRKGKGSREPQGRG